MLESALASPFQTFESFSPYATIQQIAARLAYGLVMNHPFIDGNKRIGAHTMLTLLALNGIEIVYTQKELSELILNVAAGQTGYEEIIAWILNHQV